MQDLKLAKLERPLLAEMVDRLPRRQRQVVLLKVYEGLKFVEIAEAAGMSVGTAKATFFQAIRGLRVRMGIDATPTDGGVRS